MFLIFFWEFKGFLYFVGRPPRILGGIMWKPQKEPPISNSKIPMCKIIVTTNPKIINSITTIIELYDNNMLDHTLYDSSGLGWWWAWTKIEIWALRRCDGVLVHNLCIFLKVSMKYWYNKSSIKILVRNYLYDSIIVWAEICVLNSWPRAGTPSSFG
jgi:hypothetical protein